MKSFSPRLAFKAIWQLRVRGKPFVLSHSINARCNLRCRFCEYWSKPGKEMSTQEILRMLNDAQSFGIGIYNAWTVEPLMRADLPDILRHAKKLGLITSIITNGLLLRKRAIELKDLDYLSVSMDGIKSYKKLRGVDHHLVVNGIKAAKDTGHEILLNCVISGKNLDELENLVHFAESLGVSISFEPLHESERIEKEVWDEMGIRDIPGYKKAIDRLMEMKKEGAPIINSLTYLQMIKTLHPRFRCRSSDIIIHVASDGTIENCRIHKAPLGKVSDRFSRAWNSSREERKRIKSSCRGCLFFGYVENSLLYDFVPEVMAHYKWM